jgi:hypothetical protein
MRTDAVMADPPTRFLLTPQLGVSMSSIRIFGVIAMSAALCGGCGEAQQEDTDHLQQKLGPFTQPNGKTQYYISTVINNNVAPFTDVPIGGVRNDHGWKVMDKLNASAAVINSVTYNGRPVSSLASADGWFYVATSGQAEFLADGSTPINLHVTAPFNGTIQITQSAAVNPNSGQRYVANFLPDGGGSTLMCPTLVTPGTAEQAPQYKNEYVVPIAGMKWNLETGARTTDEKAITFACGDDPIGACVAWGYEPWATYTPSCGNVSCIPISMVNHHQSCARMKRADFCGDGRSFTWSADPLIQARNVLIQAWDNAGVHDVLPQTRNTMEASWTPNGASCVNMSQLRLPSMLDGNGNTFNAATTCGAPIPACSTNTPLWYTGSAPPCTRFDARGLCIGN